MRIPDPIANTTTEAYLAYKAGVLSEGDLKPKLYDPYIHLDAWLAYWAGLVATYPVDKNNDPETLTDEEALIAYLSGVTNTYPEEFRDPADVRVAAYLKYLVSARFGRPEYPVTNEELYLSMMDAPYIPAGEPSSDIEIDDTAEAPFKDVKMYGDTSQATYTGKNKLNYYANYQVGYSTTINGVTYTMLPDGGIRMQGKNNTSSNSSFTVIGSGWDGTTVQVPLDGSTTYMSSISRPSNTYRWYVRGIGSGGSVVTLNSNNNTVSFSGCSGITYVMLQVVPNAEVNGVVYPMVEIGDQATSFEPYVGGVPAPNPDYPQPVQVVTGENTVKICGKNLLKLPSAGTNAGVTYSINSDGTFNVHGTNNSGYEILFSLYLDSSEFQSVNYTLGAREALPYGLGCRCETYRGGTWKRSFVSVNYTRQTQTGTPDFTDANRVRVAITVANGATVNIDNVGIQLEKGSSPTTFEPYQEQSYEVNLGKNLFDAANADVKTGYILNNSGVEVSDNTGGYTRNYSVVKPNTTYTISGLANAGTRRIYYYDGAKNFISRSDGSGASSWQFTTPANCYFVNVQIYTNTDSSTSMASWQIEIGSQATDFAAYFTPIELCKIGTYQDYIYKDGTDWKIHKATNKTTLTGSEGWYNAGGNAPYGLVINDSLITTSNDNPPLVYCDKFYRVSQSASWSAYSSLISSNSTSASTKTIRIRYTSVADLPAFQTWLGSNNTILYYVLATPTDTEITNTSLIDQLNALKNGGSYTGTTYIKVSATDPNLPGLLKVEAYKYD